MQTVLTILVRTMRAHNRTCTLQHILKLHCLNTGNVLRTFPLDVGSVQGFSGKKKYSEIFYQFQSFLTPGIIYAIDLKKENEPRVSISLF